MSQWNLLLLLLLLLRRLIVLHTLLLIFITPSAPTSYVQAAAETYPPASACFC